MTVALAALSAVLAAGIAIVAIVYARQSQRLQNHIAELEHSRSALEHQLSAERSSVEASEGRLELNRRRVESAERMRLEREWRELAGPVAPLPAEWSGAVGPALAVELELIREVVGTPSTMEVVTHAIPDAGFRIAMCAEFLRAIAREADEMTVLVHDEVVVTATTGAPGSAGGLPNLDGMARRVAAGGAQLIVDPAMGGFRATLRFDQA